MLGTRNTATLCELRRDEAVAPASREANPEWRSEPRHDYGDGARSVKGARVRRKLFDATLGLIEDGNLRPSLGEISMRAGVRRNAVNEQFGYVHLLFRQLVRERPDQVVAALRLPVAGGERAMIELAWMILTGCRPDRIGTLA